MISPLIPYAIQGAIWYQGESNAGKAYAYRTLFPTMIQSWRNAWGQGDFAFLFVQLAAFKRIWTGPQDASWPELREAQTLTLSLPNTGMAVTTDVGNESDIHPRRKQPVGARLALAARGVAYGEHAVFSGPTYDSMKKVGSKAEITFKHAAAGLVTRGDGLNPALHPGHLVSAAREDGRARQAESLAKRAKQRAAKSPNDRKLKAQADAMAKAAKAARQKADAYKARVPQMIAAEKEARKVALAARNAADMNSTVKGFAICGPDHKFVWAHAEIAGPNKVIVHSPKVTEPVAVRFAWEDYPICNLYNSVNLPAVPFRTDDFAMVKGPQK